uniref:AB hydrolase-1 domain-containing protein n=1 Tax=Macrostomum lignano TaxID=282301 RepID=A0A1I8F3X4_9PLAT
AYFDDDKGRRGRDGGGGHQSGVVKRAHDILDYIYHCNAQPASGETGFRYLAAPLGFAKRPLYPPLPQLEPRLPVSLIFGGRSWLFRYGRPADAPDLATNFGNDSGRVAGRCNHHLYAEDFNQFNKLVQDESQSRLESASGSAADRDGDAHGAALLIHESARLGGQQPLLAAALLAANFLIFASQTAKLDCSFVMPALRRRDSNCAPTAPGADPRLHTRGAGRCCCCTAWAPACGHLVPQHRAAEPAAPSLRHRHSRLRPQQPRAIPAGRGRLRSPICRFHRAVAAGRRPARSLLVCRAQLRRLPWRSATQPSIPVRWRTLLADPWACAGRLPATSRLRCSAGSRRSWTTGGWTRSTSCAPRRHHSVPAWSADLRGDLRNFFDDERRRQQRLARRQVQRRQRFSTTCTTAMPQVPSGETGFRRLCHLIALRRRPCLSRIDQLPAQLPLTVLYGGQSRAVPSGTSPRRAEHREKLRSARPAGSTQAGGVRELPECGHHIYAEDWRSFNAYVLEAFEGYA